MNSIYIYDPTAKDTLSKNRGVGRYLQLLHESLNDEAVFTSDLKKIPYNSTLLNPFFDFMKPPFSLRRIAAKQIAVIHDVIRLKYPQHFPAGMKGNIYSIINKINFSHYDSIITDSMHSKKDIVEILNIPDEIVKVIYLPLPSLYLSPAATHTSLKISLPQKYMLYVADITWNKNIVNLAQAIKLAQIPCVFVGKSFLNRDNLDHHEKKDFKRFLQIVDNDPLFIFPGYVGDAELIQLYRNAQFNVLISWDEGFGLSFLEAASQKTPSLLSDTKIFHETADTAALFANPANPQDIANKMRSLFEDNHLRSELAQKAYERSLFFNQKRFKEQLLEVLKK